MKEIPLTQNRFAFVDDSDFDWLNSLKWCVSLDGYRSYAMRRNGGSKQRMHRLILNLCPGDGLCVDHIDGDGLNNQRGNLRICLKKENRFNARIRSDSKSPYKGVRPPRPGHRWEATIQYHGKRIHLGSFPTAEKAAHDYDKAAVKLFGKFAKLNFPVEVKDAT